MANNNLLFIVLIVAAVLLLNGGLTGGVVNYQLPQVSKYMQQPKISIPAAQLSPLEQSQENMLTNLKTQIQTTSSKSWNEYISLVQKDVSLTNKLDLIGENMALSATELGCNCICQDTEPDKNGHYGAYGKACVKACVVSAGSPGGDASSVCIPTCTTYCGNTPLRADCKAECTNPPV